MSKLRGAIWDLLYYIRRGEFAAAFRCLSDTSRILLCHRIEYIVFARYLEETLPSYEARLPATFYPVAEPDDLACLRNVVLPSEFEYMRKRLAHGRICTLAFCQGRVAAYAWATDVVSFEIDNLRLRLRPADIYIDNLYTLPACRRQGIQTALHVRQLQYLRECDFKRAVSIVAVDNIPSQKIFRKFGYLEVDRLSFQRILFKRDYHYHNGEF
jgi:ribosomal protein S18 acetylase RimI-like enzyme